MSNILTIGYFGEGSTDKRFLESIIKRTFEALAYECKGQIEVYEPQYIDVSNKTFSEQALEAAIKSKWYNVLCIHTDADSNDDAHIFKHKIIPSLSKIKNYDGVVCRNIVPIVPTYMTEAWMLADTTLLIDEIGTNKNEVELNLPTRINQIENINNPKDVINNALNTAYYSLRRKPRLNISDLYTPISQKVSIARLQQLPSYNKFFQTARHALQLLNYL